VALKNESRVPLWRGFIKCWNIVATRREGLTAFSLHEVLGSLRNAREFVPVGCQPRNTLHFRLVKNQQHEDVIRDVPFARDSMLAGGSESESGIVVRVGRNNDKWVACILEFPVPRFDQFTPDPWRWRSGSTAIGPNAAPVTLPPIDSGLYMM